MYRQLINIFLSLKTRHIPIPNFLAEKNVFRSFHQQEILPPLLPKERTNPNRPTPSPPRRSYGRGCISREKSRLKGDFRNRRRFLFTEQIPENL
ncbi:hypothetical protein CEXT_227221 [Caerostris extrusa]|uniref:Uncharacterized protein n=1 Tax=Caerostris extrusa TaxID=172846 RepID=A0AAV4NC73_CAEEX|nr:hypothetical protein CEXT_227221 [Caerostris extrusa]